jgi:enediyne biosynthesis protein E4
LVTGKKDEEDMGSALFDADGDKDLDLLVAGGSTEFDKGSPLYTPRLYLNDGKGNFTLSKNAISPTINTSASCVVPFDYDNDGDMDVFIGGRVSLEYPMPPRSYLLQNNNGVFTDVTNSVSEKLEFPGMVTSAVWIDFNNDKQMDLVISGEWMPIRFFKNEKGKFTEVTNSIGLINNEGMWRILVAADIDNDGDVDLIAGNFGSNNKYAVDSLHPMKLFSVDIDNNGSIDPVICYYILTKNGQRKLLPGISLSQLAEQVPSIKKKFLYNADYSKAEISGIIDNVKSEKNLELNCFELRSCWFENIGNGKFKKHVLPLEAQFAPVNAIVAGKF